MFIMLYNVVLNLSLWMKSFGMTIQMKATDHYLPVVLSELGAFSNVPGLLAKAAP